MTLLFAIYFVKYLYSIPSSFRSLKIQTAIPNSLIAHFPLGENDFWGKVALWDPDNPLYSRPSYSNFPVGEGENHSLTEETLERKYIVLPYKNRAHLEGLRYPKKKSGMHASYFRKETGDFY